MFSGVFGYFAAISLYAGPTIFVSAVWQVPQSLFDIRASPSGSLEGGAGWESFGVLSAPPVAFSEEELLQAIAPVSITKDANKYTFFNLLVLVGWEN